MLPETFSIFYFIMYVRSHRRRRKKINIKILKTGKYVEQQKKEKHFILDIIYHNWRRWVVLNTHIYYVTT